MDGMTAILVTLYFKFVSVEWVFVQMFGISLATFSLIALLWLPESPKFLYNKGRHNCSKNVLNTMAKLNGRNSKIEVIP
jgi:hypothetical protein